ALHHNRIVRSIGALAPLMEELLEIIERLRHLGNRWRNECRIRETRPPGADPVLTLAKFAWRFSVTPHALHQLGMNLADQAKRQRQLGEALDSIVQCPNVIHDFCSVVKSLALRWFLAFFKANDFIESGVDTLNL